MPFESLSHWRVEAATTEEYLKFLVCKFLLFHRRSGDCETRREKRFRQFIILITISVEGITIKGKERGDIDHWI